MVVQAGTGEDPGVDVRRQAVRSTVEPGKLNSPPLAGVRIDDVGIEAVVVVVLFRGWTVELIT